ncbi:MAG: hypothetical protein EOM12_04015 [Verrucomicrobiae bacterium]|nr:hypothetical protein [Verrucomicrobiae bacterium]
MHDLQVSAREGRDCCKQIIMWPKQWKSFGCVINNPWQSVKYERRNLEQLPEIPGVYVFVAKPGIANLSDCNYLLYIGKAEDQTLKKRCKQYLNEKRKKKPRVHILDMLENWSDHLFLYYITVDPVSNASTPSEVEAGLLAAFMPPMNRQLPGKLNRIRESIYR